MNKKKIKAFELKFEAKTYKEIAEQTGYSQGSLEVYLSQKGKWYEEYFEWQEKQINEIENNNKKVVKRLSKEALKTVERLLSSKNEYIALRAAQDILNRNNLNSEDINKQSSEDVASIIWNRYANSKQALV